MKKQLFFDDSYLFGRDNVIRKYGKPRLIRQYSDGVTSTDYCAGYVFELKDGRYRMLYFGHSVHFSGKKVFSAISEDGVNFTPEQLFDVSVCPDKEFPHEIMSLPQGWEIAFIYEDEHCDSPGERYKLLMSQFFGEELRVQDGIYTSGDLIEWHPKNGAFWGDGTEPLASVFYNKHQQTHTVIERPFWGVRCAGYKETADWENFTSYQQCLTVDSLDERLAEVYGMYAFEYEGMYIGVPHLYRGLDSELNAKYKNGIIDTQLAYSYDGRYWQRSLREPFITGLDKEPVLPIVWISNARKAKDGSVYFYGTASELEHGPAFHQPGHGHLLIYKLRSDGFLSLATENKDIISCVATREKLWHSGEFHVNLKAEKATVAVYISDESEHVGGNVLGIARPLEGYGHDDCIPFSGDSTDWVPQYKSGKKIDDLRAKTIVFELKFENGEVFSFSGDYTDLFNTQGARYRKLGVLPE